MKPTQFGKNKPILRGIWDGITISVFCPYCDDWHSHGYGGNVTHRAAHCTNPKSPYRDQGYYLAEFSSKDRPRLLNFIRDRQAIVAAGQAKRERWIRQRSCMKDVPVAPSPTPAPTLDDIRHAVLAMNDKMGKPTVLRLLKRYGANKVSEIKSADYAAVIADVNEHLEEKGAGDGQKI